MIEFEMSLNDPRKQTLWMDNVRNEIKGYISMAGFTMRRLVQAINERKKESLTPNNFSTKLTRETLRYKDVKMIADILGYDIVWVKRKEDQ